MSILAISLLIVLMYCSEVKLQHSDNPQILFRFQEKYETEFVVAKNQTLDIILDNFFAKYAWCLKFYYTNSDDIFVNHIHLNGSSDSVINVPKVKDNMITKWWCVVLQEYKVGEPYNYHGSNYTAHYIIFNLRNKLASIYDYKLTYIILAVSLASILILIIVMVYIKKCCCKQAKPLPQISVDPASVFYMNLEIFRRDYERQLQGQEPVYEEID